MKANCIVFTLITAATIVLGTKAQADSFTFDTIIDNGTLNGGSGTWDLTTRNWTQDSGVTNVVWPNDTGTAADDASFTGTPATITVTDAINARRIILPNASNYTFSGTGSLTLGHTLGGGITPGTWWQNTATFNIPVSITGSDPVTFGTFLSTYTFNQPISSPAGGPQLRLANQVDYNFNVANTYDGGTYIGYNSLDITTNNSSPFGTGPISMAGSAGGPSLENTSASGITISNSVSTAYLVLGNVASIELRGANPIELSGTISPGGDTTEANRVGFGLTTTGSGQFVMSGTLNYGARRFVKSGAGILTLTSTGNSINASTELLGGTLVVADRTTLGSEPTTLDDDRLELNGGGLRTTADITFGTNSGILVQSGGGSFAPDANTTLLLQGPLSGSGNLSKSGDGTLIVQSASSYSGTLAVDAGMLLIDGTFGNGIGAITVNAGTLAGTGTIDASVTNTATGTVAPGTSPGTLTIDGDFSNDGTLAIQLAGLAQGTEYDLLKIQNGNALLGGVLSVELLPGFWPERNTTFDIVTVTGGTLTNDGIVLGGPDGSWFSMEMNNGILTLTSQIPEPATALLFALAGLALMRRRR